MECRQCPISCGADRAQNAGLCGVKGVKIAKYYLHPFEEPPVSFKNGSGCIFFCGCSLKCVFCQNYELSRNTRGKEISVGELSEIFRSLQQSGAENINLINPTHYLADIENALKIFQPDIPIVYNTHGYETKESLERANDFVDIFLPDLKFIDSALSKRYTARADYARFALPAVSYMAKKPLKMRADGKMLSGCIVRHLVLPLAAYDSVNIVKFLSETDGDFYFSLMGQYTPFGEVDKYKELQRKITAREYKMVVDAVKSSNLKNVFLQSLDSSEKAYIPQWDY